MHHVLHMATGLSCDLTDLPFLNGQKGNTRRRAELPTHLRFLCLLAQYYARLLSFVLALELYMPSLISPTDHVVPIVSYLSIEFICPVDTKSLYLGGRTDLLRLLTECVLPSPAEL